MAELLGIPMELSAGVQKRVRSFVALECIKEHGGQQYPKVHASIRFTPLGQRVQ